MHLIPSRAGRPSARRTETFTGEVWGDPASQEGTYPVANTVVFTPGARTYWHRHEAGQLIVATHGTGFAVRQDGHGGALHAGESVWTPGGEVHSHGAGPDSLLTHIAYSFGPTEWFGEVTQDEYLRAVRRSSW